EPANRAEILRTGDIFRARVVDVTPVSFVLEATGDGGKLGALMELWRPWGCRRPAKPADRGRPEGGRLRRLTTHRQRGKDTRCPPRSTTTRTPISACSRAGRSRSSDTAASAPRRG